MEKTCEFCQASRPVVHCKADAAHLCLPCDAKIHSANAIVNRHHRTVLCDSCNYLSAYVQCLDHDDHRIRLMCHFCDQGQHEIPSSRLHPKRQFSGYTGCPSAEQFAAIWGFQLNDDVSLSSTNGVCVEFKDSNTLGQILHLKRLQLTDQETSMNIALSSVHHKLIYGQGRTSHDLSSNTSSTVGVSLHTEVTEPVWQYPSRVQSTSQVDSQNMQNQLQVCKNLIRADDSNSPIDECLAFLNIEELLRDDDVDDDNNHDGVSLSFASSTMDESRADTSIHINGSSSSSTSSSVFYTIPSNVSSYGLKGGEHLEARAKAVIRYKEKKQSRSLAKTIRYPNRKARADVRKRVNGRFV